ncbi:ROK family protein [Brevibacillus sp. HB1.2]|uniref:ROK family protein n=1 Tax=Brevibacillus TaxID=55080 RepID=UPI0003764345|nr:MULTISPECIES: ROK family protein [unclassified Brevibacillus]ATF16365.1 ROK family protein [Brevibacillus brevis X23]NRS18749.1 ROK family protein [Brevibacillus sp. HB1.4B]NTU24106.1 ROK family protein [Brevibacillus sp. HB1.2]
MRHVIGLDVGGTTMKGAVMDENGRILLRAAKETKVHNNLPILIERMAALINELRDQSPVQIEAVGIGFPGPFDAEKGISVHSPNFQLHQADLRTPLAKLVELPLFFENDLRTAAFGEAIFGAGREVSHLVFVPLGTGVGAGIVNEGKLVRGSHGFAGEIGHVRYPGLTAPCNCGKLGCVETVASATGIARLARERLDKELDANPRQAKASPLFTLCDGQIERITAEQVATAVEQGDAVAICAWNEVCEVTGWALSVLVNVCNPQLVVIGGGVCRAGELLLAPVQASVQRYAMEVVHQQTKIVLAELGADAGMLGAGALALQAMNREQGTVKL